MRSENRSLMPDLSAKLEEACAIKENFELIFNAIPDAAAITRLEDGLIIDANSEFLALGGWDTKENIIGRKTTEIDFYAHPEDRGKLTRTVKEQSFCKNLEIVIRRQDGSTGSYIISASIVLLEGKPYMVSVIRDISERKQMEEVLRKSEERYRVLAENVKDVIWIADPETGYFLYVSPSIYALNGYTPAEIMSQPMDAFLPPEEATRRNAYMHKMVDDFLAGRKKTGESTVHEWEQPRKDGSTVWTEVVTNVYRNQMTGRVEVLGVIRDITLRKKSEEEILYLSYHDQLTGLYNRRFYEEELKRLDTERNLPITLVMADVNGLKLTNDAFGHAMGDQLLRDIARVLKEGCRVDDIVARVGGDEFILLLPRTSLKDAEKLVYRLKKKLHQKQEMGRILSVSFGVAMKDNSSTIMASIYKQAEDRMYRHKLSESKSMKNKTLKLITKSLYAKNAMEKEHCLRVSEVCRNIGKAMAMDPNDVNELGVIGIVHDIGKIGVDEKILNKPGKPEANEWSEIQRHSEIGYQILRSFNEFADIADFVLAHHERMDGGGYPRGLTGMDIPLKARILSVAEAYAVMSTEYGYRSRLSEEATVAELKNNAGTQFDAAIVNVFVEKVLGCAN